MASRALSGPPALASQELVEEEWLRWRVPEGAHRTATPPSTSRAMEGPWVDSRRPLFREPYRACLQGQMPRKQMESRLESCRVDRMLVFCRSGFWSERAYLKIELKVLLEALWEPGEGAWQLAQRWLGWLGFIPCLQVRADLGGPQASPCV